MACLGVEPGAAGWKAQTNPLSYVLLYKLPLPSFEVVSIIFCELKTAKSLIFPFSLVLLRQALSKIEIKFNGIRTRGSLQCDNVTGFIKIIRSKWHTLECFILVFIKILCLQWQFFKFF